MILLFIQKVLLTIRQSVDAYKFNSANQVAACRIFFLASWMLLSGHMLDPLSDPVSQQLERYMDLVSMRQKLVASNIANVDTPGYRTRDIDFQFEFETLQQGQQPRVVEVPSLAVKNDGNDVSIDRESRLLAENDLRFRLATSLLKDQFSTIKSIIQGDKT